MSVTQAQSIALHFLVTSLMLFGHSKKKTKKRTQNEISFYIVKIIGCYQRA